MSKHTIRAADTFFQEPADQVRDGYPVEAGAYWVGWLASWASETGAPGLPGDLFNPPYFSWSPGDAPNGAWGSYVATRGPFATRAEAERASKLHPSQVVQPFTLMRDVLTDWLGYVQPGHLQLTSMRKFNHVAGRYVGPYTVYYWRYTDKLTGQKFSGRNAGRHMALRMRAVKRPVSRAARDQEIRERDAELSKKYAKLQADIDAFNRRAGQ